MTVVLDRLDLYVEYDCPAPVSEEQWREWFGLWLQALEVDRPCEISLCLTNDDRIRSLNRQFRHIDRPTDVLAFAAREAPMPAPGDIEGEVNEGNSQAFSQCPVVLPLVLGDIVISVATAFEQAREHRHSLREELAWLATHGLLHLLGWDHPDEASLQKMLDKQQQLIDHSTMSQSQHGQATSSQVDPGCIQAPDSARRSEWV